ncbi:alpha/beta hydrolase [Curtobacterium flaccumfaciens]|uniref:alpha/beta hydrolase n=1 Tax=Curtobacterium flaccumfaciens TaxID=2035 RepID=UPI001ADD112B|nr:alpha/beta hydrolase [Curtobacterium flaccumfaciens]MBO9042077.1 alpha/beta hydrolase [Curtobacterium flaccumfaciens pv. flaccumfaciens]
MTSQPRPPFDPELEAVLPVLDGLVPKNVTLDDVDTFRALTTSPPIEETIAGRPILHTVRTIPGPVGAPDLTVSVFERTDHTRPGPGIFHTHGGGLIGGDRFVGAEVYLDWVERFDAVVVSVEYRRPPEHPDPAPIEDVYAGLVWTADHAAELRVDPARIVIAGESAGAGLTAGLALLARDRKGPDVLGQVLMYPLLDERNDTVSSHQDDSAGTWDRTSTETAWDAYLGARRGTGGASIYASPSLATDLSHLPPAFIDVGSAELLRDEDVAFASAIWAAGGSAELHVWSGGFHGFDQIVPAAAVSRAATAARTGWLERLLGKG